MNLKEHLKHDLFFEPAEQLIKGDYCSADLYDKLSSAYEEVKNEYGYSDWDMEQIVNHMEFLEDLAWMDNNRRKFKKHNYVDSEDWEVAMYLVLTGISLVDWRAIKEECGKYQFVPAWFSLDVLDQMISIKENRNPNKADQEIEFITAIIMMDGWSYEELEAQGKRKGNYCLADEYGENWSRILKAAKQMEGK